MPYDRDNGVVADIPAGLGGIRLDDNRLQRSAFDLIDAEGITQEDGVNRKEGGAALLDTAGIGNTVTGTATLGATAIWRAAMATYAGASISFTKDFSTTQAVADAKLSGTLSATQSSLALVAGYRGSSPAFVRRIDDTTNSVGTTQILNIPVAGVSDANHVIVTIHTAGSLGTFTVTDTNGNVYTQDAVLTDGGRVLVFSSNIASSLVTVSDFITVTCSVAEEFSCTACEYSGITAFDDAAGARSEEASADSGNMDATTFDTLLIGALSVFEESTDTFTPAAGWTKRAEQAHASTNTFYSTQFSRTITVAAQKLALAVPVAGVASGDSVILACAVNTSSPLGTFSATDSKGNTYTLDATHTTGIFQTRTAILSAHNITALVNGDTITVTFPTANGGYLERAIVAAEFDGLTGVDKTATASGASTSVVATPGALASVPQALVMAGSLRNTGAQSVTATNSFTKNEDVNLGTSSNLRLWQQYRIDTTSGTIIGLHDWWPTSDSADRAVITAAHDGNLYKSNSATTDLNATTLATGLSATARPGKFVQGGKETAADARHLFYFNGVDQVHEITGTGTTAQVISAPASDWSSGNRPVGGVIHRARLVAFGNKNQPHAAYFSLSSNHEDFTTDPLVITTNAGVGDRLYNGASFNGVLYLWKYPRGIFWLDDNDLAEANWGMFTKTEAIGCAPSPHAVCPMDDDVLFMNSDGTFHLLSAVDALSGTQTSDLSHALRIRKWLRENVNLTKLDQVTSCWYSHKKVALFGVPSAGSSTNDLILKFDFASQGDETDGAGVKFTYTRRDTADALALYRDLTRGIEIPMIGEGGFVYKLDQDARTKNGIGYVGAYQTPHLDGRAMEPSYKSTRKNFNALELVMEPVAAGTLTVEVYIDGTLSQTLEFDATKRRQRRRLVGNGYEISLRVSNETASEDFKVLSHHVFFKPMAGEAQGR